MKQTLFFGAILSACVGAIPLTPDSLATRTTSCKAVTNICGVKPNPAKPAPPLISCGSRGGVNPSKIKIIRDPCTVASVKACAASCFSLSACKSFKYNAQTCTLFGTTINQQDFTASPQSQNVFYNKACFTHGQCYNLEAIGSGADGALLEYFGASNIGLGFETMDPQTAFSVNNYTLDPITGYIVTADGASRLEFYPFDTSFGGVLQAPIAREQSEPPIVCTKSADPQPVLSCQVPGGYSAITQFIALSNKNGEFALYMINPNLASSYGYSESDFVQLKMVSPLLRPVYYIQANGDPVIESLLGGRRLKSADYVGGPLGFTSDDKVLPYYIDPNTGRVLDSAGQLMIVVNHGRAGSNYGVPYLDSIVHQPPAGSNIHPLVCSSHDITDKMSCTVEGGYAPHLTQFAVQGSDDDYELILTDPRNPIASSNLIDLRMSPCQGRVVSS